MPAPHRNPWQSARPPSPARQAAHFVLMRALDPQAPGCDALLEEIVRRDRLVPEDIALARELTFGVLRNRLWLEHVLARHLERPIAEFAPGVHEALLLGIYQLGFMDRIPPHSAVDETVRLAAAQPSGGKLKGLTNAVMRKAAASPREQLQPTEETPWPLRFSVPADLIDISSRVLSASELPAFFEANNRPAPLCLRPAGASRGDIERFDGELIIQVHEIDPEASISPGQVIAETRVITGRGMSPDRLPLFRDGLAAVEDEGAQTVGIVAADGLSGPIRVVDLCASPGGKTSHLADLLPDAQITATDVSPAKLKRLSATLDRLRLSDRIDVQLAAEFLAQAQPNSFDLVLVDAPCSGLGTLRRHPEIRYRRSTESIREISEIQFRLLGQVAGLVRPGGRLVYSVCTMTAEETEGVRDRFLNEFPGYTADNPVNHAAPPVPQAVANGGAWRLLTHRHGTDSFYIARFTRL